MIGLLLCESWRTGRPWQVMHQWPTCWLLAHGLGRYHVKRLQVILSEGIKVLERVRVVDQVRVTGLTHSGFFPGTRRAIQAHVARIEVCLAQDIGRSGGRGAIVNG